MKKVKKILLILIIANFIFFQNSKISQADWYERPTARPTQPSYPRETPTEAPAPTSIIPTSQPTITPSSGGTGGVPTAVPTQAGGISEEDPCAPGKSYIGPYCGWSPEVGSGAGGGTSSSDSEPARVGGPQVLGLSSTSSIDDLRISDIMLLTGVLCLLLYAKSKWVNVELR